ncbi:MAG: GntR family transcriptional regulator [Lachnospiraceae bacterium]|nr:GntR family transcriptional regulator [Lachnospiraceae bacterium]
MPKARYQDIYQVLKNRIEDRTYPFGELLPSENELTTEFACSRNTVRRALSGLIELGYVQAMQGKGVRCIYHTSETVSFFSSEIETFREAAFRNKLSYRTDVVHFEECTVDAALAEKSGFPEGEAVYYLQRVHVIDDKPLIMNHNYFLKSVAEGLTEEIAGVSVYDYLENVLDVKIVSSKRVITVDKITALDKKYLHLSARDYNCLAVITSITFDGNGTLFEYTQSRHLPQYFSFSSNAVRKGHLLA